MKIIQLLNLLVLFVMLNARYSLYHSDDHQESNSGFDCLYAYMEEKLVETNVPYIRNSHLIPYCRRLDQNSEEEKLSIPVYENVENNITFAELYRQGVTSIQLLHWSAPIDIAERYEENGAKSNEVFYNCSSPWFGSMCQYRFDAEILLPPGNIIQWFMDNYFLMKGTNDSACYSFLTDCYRGPSPMCLDWHEICDGKFDCLNGEDEEFCQLLEINECSKNEYRCHYGGQCIPSAFVNDGKGSIDCLDASDETDIYGIDIYLSEPCWRTATFRCEEFVSQRDRLTFSCGDGEFHNQLIYSSLPRCSNYRDKKMSSALINSIDYITDYKCQQVFICLLGNNYPYANLISLKYSNCESVLNQSSSNSLSEYCSSDWLVFPEYPILFGLFQFVYLTNRSIIDLENDIMPDFICFNASRCPALVFCSVDIGMHNGLHCCQTNNLTEAKLTSFDNSTIIFQDLILRCLTIGTDERCSHPSLFHCPLSSKCVSKHRLVDGTNDCYFGEDESFSACQLNDSWRFSCELESNKCLSMVAIKNEKQDCQNGEDEWTENERNIREEKVRFGFICDGKNDWLSMDVLNETDETHCEWWPCNTPNVRCDGFLDCLNGNDELNCPQAKCSLNELECRWIMLPTDYYCISPFDLIETCSHSKDLVDTRSVYVDNRIPNDSMNYFFWNATKCITPEHILSCQPPSPSADNGICSIDTQKRFRNAEIVTFRKNLSEEYRCILSSSISGERRWKRFLTTSRLGYFPSSSSTAHFAPQVIEFKNSQSLVVKEFITRRFCVGGIAIWFKSKNIGRCLCPPNSFGDRCEWQNERISLTVQFIYRSYTYIISIFEVIIMLIDDQGQITRNYEEILYIPKDDCSTKFNLYLLYPDRPKTRSINYSIRIDIYDKIKLKYWSSWYLSIPFQFLPVNRISTQLFIPAIAQIGLSSCSLSCGIHGQCMKYINQNNFSYCQCEEGYSGKQCEIKENCSCSSDSYCLTSSICICPLNKFGKKCYLKQFICEELNNSCLNNGICISIDDRINLNEYRCSCKEGFYGKRCEYSKNEINFEFNNEIIEMIIPAIFIHLISSFEDADHEHTTIFKKIIYGQNQITISTTQSFNLVFMELFNKKNYYLIILREKFLQSEIIQTKFELNNQCIFIHEFLNKTFQSYSYFHRIKYYPLLCRENQELKCFYDEHYMCICDLDRFSNCFLFNFNRTYNCQGYINCENNGQCFQDNITCPSKSICVCSDCFYGTKCQFSTKGLVLSLDYILAYHIKPNISLFKQPLIIKISMMVIIMMFIIGLINGILSILTFQKEKIRETGCGFYLLISSWFSILLIFVLMIKFWQLILSQMSILTNQLFLLINCILLDGIINILLTLNDWFDACVSVERVIELMKGANFNKLKSKQMAKWVTLCIFIVTIMTHLPDPLYRDLIDDINEDEQRTWCLLRETSSLINTFNTFITFFHFLTPFLINLISIILMIIFISRFHSTIESRLTFRAHLRLQIKEHKHHLITLCALILLALPRLIISFLSGCMKSPSHSSLFLTGYLMSFLPSILTSIVFILPWRTYKHELISVINRKIRRIHHRRAV